MQSVEPAVYLVGEPTQVYGTDLPEVDAALEYLEDIGAAEWHTDAQSDAEMMVEMGGRLCYRSWKPGLNPNVTKVREGNDVYLQNILKSKHGCYDGETEVLTYSGWKKWHNVKDTDRFATLSNKGNIEYHKPLHLIKEDYKGKMYNVDSQGVNLLVTPNHRMFVCKTTTKEGRKRKNFEFISAEELDVTSHAYTKIGAWCPSDKEKQYPKNILRMLGFSIGDGHVSGNKIDFHLRRKRKIKYLLILCEKLGWFCREYDDHFIVTFPKKYKELFHNIYTSKREKQIPQYVLQISKKKQLKALLEGLIESDGHKSKSNTLYITTSKRLAGQIQQLCLHIGIAANISQAISYKVRKASYGDKPLYVLSLLTRELKPEVNKHSDAVGKSSWVNNWSGKVYCAEVPNNTLYVRRCGKPVWCGNSVLEHSQVTFILHNVSRVLTHEIVRHRVGCAISQESMRYVRLTDIPFWFPEWAKEDAELFERNKRTIEYLEAEQKWMAEHFKLDDPSVGFDLKKKKTSYMRRFAPDGVATGMMWSANFRTLRHTLELRTSQGAEEEIRLVFDLIGKIVKERYPNIFQDFERSENGEWIPEYNKI